MSDDLLAYLRTSQPLVEERLSQLLSRQKDCPATLMGAMRYSLLAPGKRIRPVLVLLAAQACGGPENDAMPAGCAAEMVHTYSLIHDDLPAMDDDDLRRGLPTCHKKFGEALAILAGDGLLTLAFQVLVENYPTATAAGCCRELSRGAGVSGMVGGQVLDLAWEEGNAQSLPRSAESLQTIHAHKTGALFRACLRMGVWVAEGEKAAGPDPHLLEMIDCYGRCLGMVFQITDDLLDVEGSEQQTGKRVGKDAERGKLTYPGLLGIEESRRRAREFAAQGKQALKPLGARSSMLLNVLDFLLDRTH